MMSSSLFSRPTSFGDSPAMYNMVEKEKQQHSFKKLISLVVALLSYIITLIFLIGDLFFDSPVFGQVLHYFHIRTYPLLPPKNWITPLWMTVYISQIPWLIYAISTICRRSGNSGDSDYLYKYPRPVPQAQLFTFSLACWSHLLFLFLIQHQSNVLAVVYTVLGAMALLFCLVTSIIHLHNYERELSTCHLFFDIWSIRIFVHNGLSVMFAWQTALIGFSSLYACNMAKYSSKSLINLNESTLDIIGVALISSMCLIALVYIILMSYLFFNALCHVIAGWIFLVLLTFSYWQDQSHHSTSLIHIAFYFSTALLSFIVCLHLVLAFFRYSGTTWRSLTTSRTNYRQAVLQGKD